MQRYLLQISFDGTPFSGWQIQPNAPSVQETINKVLSNVTQEAINVVGCGRTDTGVHAKVFFLHFDSNKNLEAFTHLHKVNTMLPKSIAAQNLWHVTNEFNARFDATTRSYEYLIHFKKDPFLVYRSYKAFNKQLDVKKMNLAAQKLLGEKDFSCFSKSRTQTFTNNCNLTEAYWEEIPNGLKFKVTANRFLRNMVRAIVGTLLEVGQGKKEVEEIEEIINSKNRSNAGSSVPAEGLYLTQVVYPKSVFDGR